MKISIVTPSFNQGAYLEATLRSLLAQNYPDLELIVIDGGSSDQSVEIIRRYASSISYWESEKDRGQSHALNKGFAHLHGEVWSWLNSDDLLEPGVLRRVADEFRQHPKAGVVYGDCLYVDEDGETVIEKFPGEPYSRLRHLAHRFIAQPSCFFRTSTVSPSCACAIAREIESVTGTVTARVDEARQANQSVCASFTVWQNSVRDFHPTR